MIVDTMSKQEVMDYIRKEYNVTILPYFFKHLKLYESKIYPACQRGKQKKVSLPWVSILSKDRTQFHLQVFGDKKHIDTLTIAEFYWQNQHCFVYIKHGLMIVFSEHALRRYEERVMECDKDTRIIARQTFSRLLKYIPLSYRTILPSPTHPLCYYFVVLDALFLGDFDEAAFNPNQSEGQIWLNTCISLKEAKTSQKGILNTLSLMPYHIKHIEFNPFDYEYISKTEKEYDPGPDKKYWSSVLCLSKSVYLINKLFVMMDLPVPKLVNDCYYSVMRYAGALLKMGGIDVSKLTPYGKDGIAIRGELDFKGK